MQVTKSTKKAKFFCKIQQQQSIFCIVLKIINFTLSNSATFFRATPLFYQHKHTCICCKGISTSDCVCVCMCVCLQIVKQSANITMWTLFIHTLLAFICIFVAQSLPAKLNRIRQCI